jgi:hypothetical protein
VVGVGVLGVALALLVRIYATHGTFDEAVIAERLVGQARTRAPTPDDGRRRRAAAPTGDGHIRDRPGRRGRQGRGA